MKTDGFEFDARAGWAASQEQMRPMVQSLLKERFGLKAQMVLQEARLEALTLATKGGRLGPGIKKCDPENPPQGWATPASV